jgi:hypothetical protein
MIEAQTVYESWEIYSVPMRLMVEETSLVAMIEILLAYFYFFQFCLSASLSRAVVHLQFPFWDNKVSNSRPSVLTKFLIGLYSFGEIILETTHNTHIANSSNNILIII